MKDVRLRLRYPYTWIPSPLSPALSSAFLIEMQGNVYRRSAHMEVADIGATELNPPAAVAPSSPTLKLISSFPSVIHQLNIGEHESWVDSTLWLCQIPHG